MNNEIEFTRIKNDVNGNPRYVVHFLNLLTEAELNNREGLDFVSRRYQIAVKRANTIGGRKYNTCAYGGGIVFQSYSLKELSEAIRKVTGR